MCRTDAFEGRLLGYVMCIRRLYGRPTPAIFNVSRLLYGIVLPGISCVSRRTARARFRRSRSVSLTLESP